MDEQRHLWGSVTRTLCGLDAFRVERDGHVQMTSGPILRVVYSATEATCEDCLAKAD
jgi:hypothetical protein